MITTRRRGALAASLIFSLSLACSDDDSSFPDAGAAGDGTVKKKDKSTGDTGKAADKGGGVKDLLAHSEKAGYRLIEPVVEARCSPAPDDLVACRELGTRLAEAAREG